MPFSLALDVLVAVLLVITIGYAVVLNRRLGRLRRDKSDLEKLAATFVQATARAEESIGNLKKTANSLKERTDNDQALSDDLAFVREDRGAGRKAVLLALRPHDEFRFGHRLWLDRSTAFPLRTELIDGDGTILEQIRFADINLDSEISAEALLPSVSLENFTWYAETAKRVEIDIAIDWNCDDLPAGFRVVSTKTEQLPGADAPVTHILYSDGLATVSVFIGQVRKKKLARRSNIGGSNAYSMQLADYQITAIGEVPAVTVQRIASSMRPQ